MCYDLTQHPREGPRTRTGIEPAMGCADPRTGALNQSSQTSLSSCQELQGASTALPYSDFANHRVMGQTSETTLRALTPGQREVREAPGASGMIKAPGELDRVTKWAVCLGGLLPGALFSSL